MALTVTNIIKNRMIELAQSPWIEGGSSFFPLFGMMLDIRRPISSSEEVLLMSNYHNILLVNYDIEL